ncbi:hypothetical protein BZA05DRAFT_183155 [Tricharina praecox]|uniref:uncharacterized protein n=1 Tax=Tricharina praecox TaxID=43433 RepID=UPI00221F0461|nr:uncharacterized protein BZA05DRAFT_183155 [Tricharina praecox]KAI5843645.1 hypothetical protein BZA05DRAFT_183155 [Tricharina praecox]
MELLFRFFLLPSVFFFFFFFFLRGTAGIHFKIWGSSSHQRVYIFFFIIFLSSPLRSLGGFLCLDHFFSFFLSCNLFPRGGDYDYHWVWGCATALHSIALYCVDHEVGYHFATCLLRSCIDLVLILLFHVCSFVRCIADPKVKYLVYLPGAYLVLTYYYCTTVSIDCLRARLRKGGA